MFFQSKKLILQKKLFAEAGEGKIFPDRGLKKFFEKSCTVKIVKYFLQNNDPHQNITC